MTDHIEFLYDTVVKLRPGLKSRRVMVDKEKKLSEFSTADLVAELCSRDGVESLYAPDVSWEAHANISKPLDDCIAHECILHQGPATIIVVRGDE